MIGTATDRKRFPRAARLKKEADFHRVVRTGRHCQGNTVYMAFIAAEGGGRRYGVSVSRKTGGAVVRNRWKRVIREAFRLDGGLLPEGGDFAVVVRRTVKGAPVRDLRAELRALFRKAGKP